MTLNAAAKTLFISQFTMFNKALLLFGLLITAQHPLWAQKEGNIWYFGDKAGLDFNFTPPRALTDGELKTTEGCATMSDANGRLLFYTDGITVWDRRHRIMPNGFGLLGNPSATQSAVVIPKPGTTNRYIVFTVGAIPPPVTLGYSEIDMTLNNGFGDVIRTNKNTHLLTNSTEKITAIRHANGRHYWAIGHEWENNTFVAWLVDENGVSNTPVRTSIGAVHSGPNFGDEQNMNSIGYMKASADGKKLAVAFSSSEQDAQLFDFNTATGRLSNPINIPQRNTYGVEFSPDGTKLYFSSSRGQVITQYDLSQRTEAAIGASKVFLMNEREGFVGALQIAPDGRIYISFYQETSLGYIPNPNRKGTDAGLIKNGIFLNNRISLIGLPNFNQTIFSTCNANYNITLNQCDSTVLEASMQSDTIQYQWLRNNVSISTARSARYTVTQSGSYRLVIRTASGACADTSDAYVANLDAMVLDITKTDATTGFNDGTISIAIRSGGTPPYRYSIDNGRTFNDLPNFAELRPATYSVVVIDSRNCRRSRQITINERQPCSILVGATAHNVQCDDTDQLKGRITVLPQEGLAPFRFALDNGAFQSNPTFDNLDARRYRVTAVDNNGCRGAINITVPRSCGR